MDRLIEIITSVWEQGYAGIDFGKFLIAFGIFIGFLLLRQLFTKIVIKRLEVFTEKTETELDEQVLQALRRPLDFIPLIIGFFVATEYLSIQDSRVVHVVDYLIRSMIIFTFFWILYRLVDEFSHLIFGTTKLDQKLHSALLSWISNVLKLLLIAIGAASILEVWGVNIGALIAGLGLFGVAVALGAQDLFKNLIAGILILAEGRFKIGDWVKVNGVAEGTVENIGFRSTRIRRFDKAPIVVPNASLSDNPVINFSEMTHRRIYWMIGLEYRTTVAQLQQVRNKIEQLILDSDDFVSPEEAATFVHVDHFNHSSIDIMIYCFTQTTNWGEWLKIKEELALEIKHIVENAGTGFAFPSRSLYLENMPSALGKPEETPSILVPDKHA